VIKLKLDNIGMKQLVHGSVRPSGFGCNCKVARHSRNLSSTSAILSILKYSNLPRALISRRTFANHEPNESSRCILFNVTLFTTARLSILQ